MLTISINNCQVYNRGLRAIDKGEVQMANQFSYTTTLAEPNGRKFSISGTGADDATALAEHNAKLALTVGTILSQSQSSPVDPAVGAAAAGTYSNGYITLQNAAGKVVNAQFDNIVNSVAANGKIVLTNGLVTTFAAAYRDRDGVGGYTAVGGEIIR